MQNLRNQAHKLLRRSEELFETDMVYITKEGFWTTLRFVVGTLASIATMIAFGNLLPRETYGIYTYLLSLASSLAFLTLSGAGPAVVRAVARGHESVIRHTLKLQLKYNLLAVLTVGLVALYYWYKGNVVFAVSLGILAVAIPISEAFHIYEQILMGRKRFDTLAVVTTIITIISTITTIATLFLTNNVTILVLVFATMAIVPTILSYVFLTRAIPQTEPSADVIDEFRRTTFHMTGAGLISTAATYIDKIILFQIAGPASLAVYGFAIAGPERMKGLVKNWISIALPRLANRSIQDIRSVFYKRLGLALLVGILLAGTYIILSPFLFRWFLPKYLDSILYSQIYGLGIILMPVVIYVGNVFYSQNMLRAVYISSTATQVLRILLFVILGWQWQIWGLVFASILSNLSSTLFSIIIWEIESRRLIKN